MELTTHCLNVFHLPNGKFDFADGVLAFKGFENRLPGTIDWPLMVRALELSVDAYAPLMPKGKEPPYMRVLTCETLGNTFPGLDDKAEGHALKALRVCLLWNRWMADAARRKDDPKAPLWEYEHVLKAFYTPGEMTRLASEGRTKERLAGSLRKFCTKSLGLRRGTTTDFLRHFRQLKTSLKEAFEEYRKFSVVHNGTS